jgi:hypothetical protein
VHGENSFEPQLIPAETCWQPQLQAQHQWAQPITTTPAPPPHLTWGPAGRSHISTGSWACIVWLRLVGNYSTPAFPTDTVIFRANGPWATADKQEHHGPLTSALSTPCSVPPRLVTWSPQSLDQSP